MQYITTTQLRTKSTHLIESLARGEEVELIHRSKLVATIKPKKTEAKALSKRDIRELIKLARSLNLPKLTDAEMEKRYRNHLLKKYGKGLS